MPMINFTNPVILLVATLIFVLLLILSKETKTSIIMAVVLFVFVALLIIHVVMYITGQGLEQTTISDLTFTMVFDLIFVLLSFIGYLWVDDIEAKVKKKKSIDNSLNWFWNKV